MKGKTAGEFLGAVASGIEMKRSAVRMVLMAVAEMTGALLKKDGVAKIPCIGRLTVKRIPAKKYPAGDYPNPFKKGPDGKPLVEHKEARVRASKVRLKFCTATQIRKFVL